jgi:hypothetical protein
MVQGGATQTRALAVSVRVYRLFVLTFLRPQTQRLGKRVRVSQQQVQDETTADGPL